MLEVNARDGFQYDWLKAGITYNVYDKHWYAFYNQIMDIQQIQVEQAIDG